MKLCAWWKRVFKVYEIDTNQCVAASDTQQQHNTPHRMNAIAAPPVETTLPQKLTRPQLLVEVCEYYVRLRKRQKTSDRKVQRVANALKTAEILGRGSFGKVFSIRNVKGIPDCAAKCSRVTRDDRGTLENEMTVLAEAMVLQLAKQKDGERNGILCNCFALPFRVVGSTEHSEPPKGARFKNHAAKRLFCVQQAASYDSIKVLQQIIYERGRDGQQQECTMPIIVSEKATVLYPLLDRSDGWTTLTEFLADENECTCSAVAAACGCPVADVVAAVLLQLLTLMGGLWCTNGFVHGDPSTSNVMVRFLHTESNMHIDMKLIDAGWSRVETGGLLLDTRVVSQVFETLRLRERLFGLSNSQALQEDGRLCLLQPSNEFIQDAPSVSSLDAVCILDCEVAKLLCYLCAVNHRFSGEVAKIMANAFTSDTACTYVHTMAAAGGCCDVNRADQDNAYSWCFSELHERGVQTGYARRGVSDTVHRFTMGGALQWCEQIRSKQHPIHFLFPPWLVAAAPAPGWCAAAALHTQQ